MKILWLNGLILLTFVNCYHGMPQDGPPAAFSKIKVAVDGFKSVGEALKEIGDKEGLLKELVNTGKTASVFKNLSAFTGILGSGFAGAQFFTDLAFGSFEARMFERVFKEFKNLNDEIRSLRAFAKRGFNQVIGSVWEAQRVNPLAKIHSAIDNFDNYRKNPNSRSLQNKLVEEFKSDDVRESVHSIRIGIPNFSQTNFVNKGKCQELLLEKGNLLSILQTAYLAFNTGCALNNKLNNNMNKREATSDCQNHVLPNLQTEILDVIDSKIQECKSVGKAREVATDFIESEIRKSDDIKSARNKIDNFLEEKYPYLTWFAVVYEPLGGFKEHKTNAEVTNFKLHNNMNIALAIMPSCKNYPKCKEDRSECPVVPSIDSMSCSFGCSAEDFYDEAEKYLTRKGYWGGYRMIVFRDTKDDDYAISWPEELPNNNGCNKHLDLGPFFPFRIVYVRNP